MQNNENQKTYFIYVRSTGEKVPVTKEQHDSFYKEADRIRHKEQDHGRCMCPYRFIWKCDGDCIGCEYHAAGDITSLDQPLPDGNGTLGDYIPDRSKPMEEVIADRMLLMKSQSLESQHTVALVPTAMSRLQVMKLRLSTTQNLFKRTRNGNLRAFMRMMVSPALTPRTVMNSTA